MKYYRVKKEFDNRRKNNSDIYIANELYTEKEAQKQNLNFNFLELVEISKRKVYFFFGARFESKL